MSYSFTTSMSASENLQYSSADFSLYLDGLTSTVAYILSSSNAAVPVKDAAKLLEAMCTKLPSILNFCGSHVEMAVCGGVLMGSLGAMFLIAAKTKAAMDAMTILPAEKQNIEGLFIKAKEDLERASSNAIFIGQSIEEKHKMSTLRLSEKEKDQFLKAFQGLESNLVAAKAGISIGMIRVENAISRKKWYRIGIAIGGGVALAGAGAVGGVVAFFTIPPLSAPAAAGIAAGASSVGVGLLIIAFFNGIHQLRVVEGQLLAMGDELEVEVKRHETALPYLKQRFIPFLNSMASDFTKSNKIPLLRG